MWSYECVFQEPVRSRKRKFPIRDGSGTTICGEVRDRSETVVSESGELALQYAGALDAAKAGIATLALDELKKHPDYDLVGIIRRHAIMAILTEDDKKPSERS